MRPLLSIFGLVFAASVLIANVNAIKCYIQNINEALHQADCDERLKEAKVQEYLAKNGAKDSRPKQCVTKKAPYLEWISRECLFDKFCDEADCTTRCNDDYCNGPAAADEGSGNDNGIKCYVENPNEARRKADCAERAKEDTWLNLLPSHLRKHAWKPTQCGIAEVNNPNGGKDIYRDCLLDSMCKKRGVDCTTRCNQDYCNGPSSGSGDPTSTLHASLLVAVVASAIAALGI